VIVLDSGCAAEYLAGLEQGPWVQEQVADDDLHAPHLLDLEVLNTLRRLVSCGRMSQRSAAGALEDLADMPLRRYPHGPLLARIWELRTHVTAYDGAYIALAEALDAPLVTTDLRLSRAHGHRATIISP
jgi:predicted nucleic acid-binding protein